jgi:hypothetical protein
MVLLSQCVDACESLGDTGGMVFAALVAAWGLWQKYQKGKAVAMSLSANARAEKAESEKELYKQLSLRPAAMPLLNLPADLLQRMQSVPSIDSDIPLSIPPDYEEAGPTIPAKPKG